MSTKAVRTFALVMGVIFIIVAVAGFIPGLVTSPAPEGAVAVEGQFGRLFGLFPVNWLHNLVHLVFGVWGVAVYRSFSGARNYARAVAVIYGVFVVMGFIPVLQTTFGLIPLYGHDIWLHFLIAVAAAYFGFARLRPEAAATSTYSV